MEDADPVVPRAGAAGVTRGKKIGIAAWIAFSIVELVIAFQFLTLEEWFRWSGLSFAAGIGFVGAALLVTAIVTSWRLRALKREMATKPPWPVADGDDIPWPPCVHCGKPAGPPAVAVRLVDDEPPAAA